MEGVVFGVEICSGCYDGRWMSNKHKLGWTLGRLDALDAGHLWSQGGASAHLKVYKPQRHQSVSQCLLGVLCNFVTRLLDIKCKVMQINEPGPGPQGITALADIKASLGALRL